MQSINPHFSKNSGVTLVELLVALAIIAVLMVLGNAAMIRLGKVSQSTACTHHLRGVGAAFYSYAGDHQGQIFLNSEKIGNSTQWLRYLIGLTDGRHNRGNDGHVYLDQPSSAVCPAFTPRVFKGRAVDVVGLTYGDAPRDYNDPASTPIPDGKYASRAVRLAQIESPSTYWLLTDTYSRTLESQFYTVGSGTGAFGIHFRHLQKANTLFADGHVQALTLKQFSELTYYARRSGYDETCNLITLD